MINWKTRKYQIFKNKLKRKLGRLRNAVTRSFQQKLELFLQSSQRIKMETDASNKTKEARMGPDADKIGVQECLEVGGIYRNWLVYNKKFCSEQEIKKLQRWEELQRGVQTFKKKSNYQGHRITKTGGKHRKLYEQRRRFVDFQVNRNTWPQRYQHLGPEKQDRILVFHVVLIYSLNRPICYMLGTITTRSYIRVSSLHNQESVQYTWKCEVF